MSTDRPLYSNCVAVVALASIGTVIALLSTSSRSLPFFTSSSPPPKSTPGSENVNEDKQGDEDEDKKLFEVVFQHYSVEKGDFVEVDQEKKEGDDDGKGSLFIVKHRSWPKSSDYEQEGYTLVEIRSPHLIEFLRSIHALREIEGVHEEEPSIDMQDLYLVRSDLENGVLSRKDEVARREMSTEETEGTMEAKDGAAHALGQQHIDDDANDKPFAVQERKSIDDLREALEHVRVLLKWLDETFAATTAKLARLLHTDQTSLLPGTEHHHSAQISYTLLWAIFPPNSFVVSTHEVSGERYAFKVKTAQYTYRRSEHVFEVSGYSLGWDGSRYVRVACKESISKFKALRRLSALPVIPLTNGSKVYRELKERGKVYVSLAGVNFLHYDGVLSQVIGCGMDKRIMKHRAEGRAVVDAKSFKRLNPMLASGGVFLRSNYEVEADFLMYGDDSECSYRARSQLCSADPTNATTESSISPTDLVLLHPTVYGFSLAVREWGEMSVLGFSSIEFRDDAWGRLVIDKTTKELIRSLVGQNSSVAKGNIGKKDNDVGKKKEGEERLSVLGDIVEGKGGGLVIALHGMPGVGKTLTAEAVAESLRVPLYTVGAGSLGTTADILEKRLQDILDIAQQWGATLLIDEADIFLERRSLHEIGRNALVSVFLRLLEYHSGVLFLTTNRLRNIDEAFLSRFSLAITYPNLDAAKRQVVWMDFLAHAGVGIRGIPNVEHSNGTTEGKEQYSSYLDRNYLEKLSKKQDLNGRVIKNIVRTAQSLALSQSRPLSEEHLEIVVKANEDFVKDYKDADEMGIYEVKGEGWKDHTNVYG